MPECDLDIMVGGTIDNILMVEGEMKEVSEEVMLGAIKFAHEEIKKHCAVQIELAKELGKDVKRTYCHEVNDEELRQTIIRELYDKAYAIATSGTMKHEREDKFNALEAEFAARFSEEELVEKAPLIHKYFHDDVQKKAMRNMILDEGKRLDGRRTDEIRPIWCEVGYLPAAHGSAIFTRGETQSLTTVTLGTKMDEKAKADGDNTVANVVAVCSAYREALHPSKMVDKDILRTHQLAFFRMVRDVLQSPSYYTQGLNVLLNYLREDSDGKGALSVPFMMRGFDDQTLASMPEDNRQLFWGFVTLLTTAAGLNDPKGTYRKVSMKVFQETTKLTPEMKQRLVSFFSS
jgi:uncharacterized Zn finger protein